MFNAYPVIEQDINFAIQPPVLADGGFRQRVEDRRKSGYANLCGIVRRDVRSPWRVAWVILGYVTG